MMAQKLQRSFASEQASNLSATVSLADAKYSFSSTIALLIGYMVLEKLSLDRF